MLGKRMTLDMGSGDLEIGIVCWDDDPTFTVDRS